MKEIETINWFGERLKMARHINMLSLRELAKRLGVSHGLLYKYEKGKMLPDTFMLIKFAKALNVKVEFFLRSNELIDLKFVYRNGHISLPAKEEKSIKYQIQEWLERYFFVEGLYPESTREISLPVYRIEEESDLEKAAKELRKEWDLGLDPLGNLVEIVEDRGLKVGIIKGTEHFDSCAFWAEVRYSKKPVPIIVIKDNIPGDRERFNISHEIGHFVLDLDKEKIRSNKKVEEVMNRFAGAFLAPDEVVLKEAGIKRKHITINELHILKMKYGLSMQAWIHRLEDLDVITPSLARSLREEFSKKNWKRKEPGKQFPFQRSTRMKKLILRALAEGILSKSKALELAEDLQIMKDVQMLN